MSSNYLSPYTESGRIIVRYQHKIDARHARSILREAMQKIGAEGAISHLKPTRCSGCNDPECPLGGDGYLFAKSEK